MDDILQSDYFESALVYKQVDWFVEEGKKIIKKWRSLSETLIKILY